ncbi:MAG: hypothetical protein ACRD50_12565 [Candidatus Acidiferrales bacterium]
MPEGNVICPVCQSEVCRRSRRHGALDILISAAGLRPWRCRACEERFYAWRVPVRYARFAHCPQCGNLDLQRIARDRVNEGKLRWVQRFLGVPAFRCDPCRWKFFSVRIYRRILPVPAELKQDSEGRLSQHHGAA